MQTADFDNLGDGALDRRPDAWPEHGGSVPRLVQAAGRRHLVALPRRAQRGHAGRRRAALRPGGRFRGR
ncbi:MAG: hypothetical protein MZW92_32465 [Comamonadaceae bacterium]|nr:hypothetical protein [Comamonadaceae bacterium]